jgi:hypothetical protein
MFCSHIDIISVRPVLLPHLIPSQVVQTFLIYGRVASNGESSRCAKTQSGNSLSSGMRHLSSRTIDAPCARQHDDFAGGGGAGGSVSIIAGSLLGGGRVEAQGEHE